MGFIQTIKGAVTGTLADQYKDAIKCEMQENILMMRKTTKSGVITDGSRIIVAPGQSAVVYNNGTIGGVLETPGMYTFDSKESESFFGGEDGTDINIIAPLKQMWERFTFGGTAPQEHAVYFFNRIEITNNGFGTPAPMMFRDYGHPVSNVRFPGVPFPMSLKVKVHGTYSFIIENVPLFMQRLVGSKKIVEQDEIAEIIRQDVTSTFMEVLNLMGSQEHQVPVDALQSQGSLIRELMANKVAAKAIADRGLKILSFNIMTVQLDAESQQKLDNYETSGDMATQQANMNEHYGKALENAGSNEGSVFNGMMGMNMINMMGAQMPNMMGGAAAPGAMAPNMAGTMGVQPNAAPTQQAGPVCSKCGGVLSPGAKFCAACGTPVPAPCTCAKCGAALAAGAKFCAECGTPVANAGPKKCPKCGAEVQGKFCAQCGSPV